VLNRCAVQRPFFPLMISSLISSSLIVASLVLSAAAGAGETLVTQDSMQVIGTPDEPAQTIDDSEIELKQARDLEDLFSATPNMAVGGSTAIAQKIYLRGIEDTKLNITIDGAGQAGQVFQALGRVAVEPELLKQVAVTQGAGSALDGFGALGGSIRFETRGADDFLQPGQQAGAVIASRYLSNTDGVNLSTHLFGRLSERWSGLLSLGHVDTGALEDGNGVDYPLTGTDNDYQLFKLSGQPADGHRLDFSWQQRTDEGVRPLRPAFRVSGWNPAGWQASNRDTATLGYAFDDDTDLIDLSFTAYRTRNLVTITDAGERFSGRVESTGFDLRNRTLLADHALTYGVAYRDDKALLISRNARETGDVTGLYLQDDIDLADDLQLSLGARYDRYVLRSYAGHRLSSEGVSPNINLEYLFAEDWLFSIGYAEALRGQSVKQVFAIQNSPTGPHLKAEQARNTELRIEYAGAVFSAGTTLFCTEIDDVVGFEGTLDPRDRRYENLGQLKSWGYNLWLEQSWDDMQLKAVYSVTRPELNGEPLNDRYVGVGTASGDRLVLQARRSLPAHNLALGWQGSFVRKLNNPHPVAGRKPGYGVHNLFMQWQPAVTEDLVLGLSINNLFDQFFYDHATVRFDPDTGNEIGIPAQGRDIRLSMRLAI